MRILHDDGWVQVRQTGSHRQFRHAVKAGTVTVAGHPSKDLPWPVLRSIMKQTGLEK